MRETLGLQRPQESDEVADCKVGRIALAVIAILLANLESSDVGVEQHLAAIAAAREHGFNEALMFPSEPSEKNGDPVTLFRSEGPL
jgi:hypothetical protein